MRTNSRKLRNGCSRTESRAPAKPPRAPGRNLHLAFLPTSLLEESLWAPNSQEVMKHERALGSCKTSGLESFELWRPGPSGHCWSRHLDLPERCGLDTIATLLLERIPEH